MRSYNAEILAVGTELLLGNIANTDAQDVSQALSELGINVYYHTVVGDNPERVKKAVAIARERADIIITTGGLGPTYDDLTKQTLAEAFGKKLYFSEEQAERIRGFFGKDLRRRMTDNNLQQAWLPEGCTVFENSCGTAPGCAFEADGKIVLMLPGPPRECRAMIRTGVMPYLKALQSAEIRSHNIHIFGMGESAVEDRLHDMMTRLRNPTLAPYAKDCEVMLRVTARAGSEAECEEMMAGVIKDVKDALGALVYGVDTGSRENTVVGLLKESGRTLALAESCTGGLVAKRITDIPGSSAVFMGGVTAYSNLAKERLIGVPPEILAAEGAVSRDTAFAMAGGARENLSADIGIGITGLAGPDPDGSGVPVGTVYVAISAGDGTEHCAEIFIPSDRNRVRTMAANTALDLVRRYLTGIPLSGEKLRTGDSQ